MTWEGDNSVLIQQTARFLIKQARSLMNGTEIKSENFKFLSLNFDRFEQVFQFENTS